jgi:RimJ/RimL family protein N-acetyltransferase
MARITVRPATSADAHELWVWRNDDLTRAMSRDTADVPWPDHHAWFERALADPLRTILIGELHDDASATTRPEPFGMCRFDANPTQSEAEVSIVIAPAMRGRGLAAHLLATAITAYGQTLSAPDHPIPLATDHPTNLATGHPPELATDRTTPPITFRATIRHDNPASIACFERNGFARTNTGPLFADYERRHPPRHPEPRRGTASGLPD